MARCVIVVYAGRTGSSMLTGVIHKLGIPMFQREKYPDANNPWGFYQCETADMIDRSILEGRPSDEKVKRYVGVRSKQADVWGFKASFIYHTWSAWKPHLPNPRFLLSLRDEQETIKSMARTWAGDTQRLFPWKPLEEGGMTGRFEAIRAFETNNSQWYPFMEVHFEDMLKRPAYMTRRIAEFCGAQYKKEAEDHILSDYRTRKEYKWKQ